MINCLKLLKVCEKFGYLKNFPYLCIENENAIRNELKRDNFKVI